MKKYLCERIDDHREVAPKIEEFEREGWKLRTYQAAGMGSGPMSFKVYHFLLFEKDLQ